MNQGFIFYLTIYCQEFKKNFSLEREKQIKTMQQLENKKTDFDQAEEISRKRRKKKSPSQAAGLASTFNSDEVKNFFVNYLTTMLVIEGLIFFFTFINHLASDGQPFPWKPYLFATFITPIAITFVFGLIILTFNKYFFRDAVGSSEAPAYPDSNLNKGDRLGVFFHVVHRLPFLLSMLLLIAATAIAYKMDDILFYAAQAGAVTARYLFFTLVAVLAVAAIGIGVWMILSYRLSQNKLATNHQYKMQLMDQFGMVLLEDGTMLGKNGNIVYRQDDVAKVGYDDRDENVQLIEEVKKD